MNTTCETRRAHLRTTATRRGGMPEPGSFFLGLEAGGGVLVGGAVAVALEVELEVDVALEVERWAAKSRAGTIPTRPVFHGMGSTSGCRSAAPAARPGAS